MKKLVVLIALISVAFNLLAYDATIGNLRVEHNYDGDAVMRIHMKLNIKGGKDKTFVCRPRFYDANDKGYFPKEVAKPKGTEFTPPYNSTVYDDFKLRILNHVLDIPHATTKKFYFIIEVVDEDNRVIAKSDPYYFYGYMPDSKKRTSDGYFAYNFDTDVKTWDAAETKIAGSSGSPSYNHSSPVESTSEQKTKCYTCNGTGQMKVYVGTSAYTSESVITYKCNICNEIMHSYDKHIHQTCSTCYGKGYY